MIDPNETLIQNLLTARAKYLLQTSKQYKVEKNGSIVLL